MISCKSTSNTPLSNILESDLNLIEFLMTSPFVPPNLNNQSAEKMKDILYTGVTWGKDRTFKVNCWVMLFNKFQMCLTEMEKSIVTNQEHYLKYILKKYEYYGLIKHLEGDEYKIQEDIFNIYKEKTEQSFSKVRQLLDKDQGGIGSFNILEEFQRKTKEKRMCLKVVLGKFCQKSFVSRASTNIAESRISNNNNKDEAKSRRINEDFDFCSVDLPKLNTECFVRLSNISDNAGREGLINHLKQQLEEKVLKDKATKEKVFECVDCEKMFVRKYRLKRHLIKIHHKGVEGKIVQKMQKYKCTNCEQLFARRDGLKRHMLVIHDKQSGQYNCEFCEKVFVRRDQLKRHILEVHTKQSRLHKCEDCGNSFKRKYHLKKHMWGIHPKDLSSRKVFYCIECEKTFLQKLRLTRHAAQQHELNRLVVIHSGEVLKVIGKGKTLKKLSNVLFGKAVNYIWSCRICYTVYETKTELKLHINEAHGDSLDQWGRHWNKSTQKYTCPWCEKELKIEHLVWFIHHMKKCMRNHMEKCMRKL